MPKSKLSDEQTIQLLREAEKGKKTVEALCREYGISDATFYKLRNRYAGSDVQDLKRLKQLEAENARLLKLVGQLTLENSAMKVVVRKKF
ncbi:transposase [Deinococcus peraridilitoris]|uniref:Transposase n=1 Tax=Deinococcus peraridilitoris (strain DSM 19664 / LMG 22246 / CIP 109416 / KR-200) TaxID=937777 RepID=L0A9F0_DEIPD|nr:transposase [Deinococcus peraridilitoris]AFZ69757.1 Transposase [Deinococcus peraridilitoris DSM 19664]